MAKETTKKTAKEEKQITEEVKKSTEAIMESESQEVIEEVKSETKTAKAGKRSAKALAEAGEKLAKEERKASAKTDEAAVKPKSTAKPARPRIERQGKKFQSAAKLVDKTKAYTLKEAVDLAIKTTTTKFDATVELHARLGLDPRQADQNIRDIVILPAGTGKTVRVAVFADIDDVAKAKKAGADIAGSDEFLQQLDKGVIDFDILISTPTMMAKLGKYAKVLGPKGLMPNPKSGTVTSDIEKAITEAKAGRVEYRVDSTGIVHVGVGKVSFGNDKLLANLQAVIASIKNAKPSSIKGSYVKSIYLSTSMGPSICVENSELN